MTTISFIIALFLISIPTVGSSQKFNQAKLDSLVSSIAESRMGMGSIAISNEGAIVYQRAFGNAEMAEGNTVPHTFATKFRIGSISKMFTAVLIFKFIEENKLQLTTTIDAFFPAIPNSQNITITDLLYHRSGLHNYSDGTDFDNWHTMPKTQDELLQIIVNKGLDFEVGAKASYSNSNYLLLSYIMERISGKPYAVILNEKILSKILLTDTYYAGATDVTRNESFSYKYNAGHWSKEQETHMSIHGGAGSLVSTPSDLVRFADALFSGKLVSDTDLAKMQTLIDDYGMGMFPFRFDNEVGFGHSGRIDGFASTVQHFPELNITIAYCTNGIVFPREEILDGLLRICFDKPYRIPDFMHPQLPTEELAAYLGEYKSLTLPISITCSIKDGSLLVETKGHPFPLQPIGKNKFCNMQYGFFFSFEGNELVLKEGDNVYYLKKV